MGIDQDLERVSGALAFGARDLQEAQLATRTLAQIGNDANQLADVLAKPDADPGTASTSLRSSIARGGQAAQVAKRARLSLAEGDSDLAEMFDASIADVETRVTDVRANLESMMSSTALAARRQEIFETIKELATSARTAAEQAATVLQHVATNVQRKQRQVDDVRFGRLG